MQAKRSYSGVLAAAAATAFSPQLDVAAADSPTVTDSGQTSDDAAIAARVKTALAANIQLLGVSKVDNDIELQTASDRESD